MRYDTVEAGFVDSLRKALKEKEEDTIHYLVSSVADDYPQRVGYLQAIKEVQIILESTHKAFFPE